MTDTYTSPYIEVVEILTEQAILTESGSNSPYIEPGEDL
jgi:hypothetical protein